jgi:hypothetical protein
MDESGRISDRDHLLAIIAANDRRYTERAAAMDEAIERARTEVDRRLEDLNNLRRQVTDDRGQFLRAETYQAQHSNLEAIVADLGDRVSALEGSRGGANQTWSLVGVGFAGVIAIVAVVVAIIGR